MVEERVRKEAVEYESREQGEHSSSAHTVDDASSTPQLPSDLLFILDNFGDVAVWMQKETQYIPTNLWMCKMQHLVTCAGGENIRLGCVDAFMLI